MRPFLVSLLLAAACAADTTATDDAGLVAGGTPDAGSPGTDAGSPGTDAGSPGTDAGSPGTDAGPTCTDACGVGSLRCLTSTAYQTCVRAPSGCSDWNTATACTGSDVCSGGQCVPSCTDQCAAGVTTCVAGGLDSCVRLASGCTDWTGPVACAHGSACQGNSCQIVCSDACTLGATRCASGGVITCVAGPSGCAVWGTLASCPQLSICVGSACKALVDQDHDGYFAFDECDDANADASPVAPEIPGDHVDENCNGAIDEACVGPVTCSPLHVPAQLGAQTDPSGFNTITGHAAPGSTVLVYGAYDANQTVVSVPVDGTGRFQVPNRFQGELVVLQDLAPGDNPSGRVWMLLPGNPAFATIPAPTSVGLTLLDPTHATLQATTALRAEVIFENHSSPAWVSGYLDDGGYSMQILPPASGFAPTVTGTVTAAGGDVIVVRVLGIDGANGYEAAPIRMPGPDLTPPVAPRLGGAPSNPGFWVSAQSEGLAVVHIVDTATGAIVVQTASPDGNVEISNAAVNAGDPLVAWSYDGTNFGPMVSAVVTGADETPPRVPNALAATPSHAGQTTVTGQVELGATVWVGNASVPAVWSGHDTYATFAITVPAQPGDRVTVTVTDAANRSADARLYIGDESGVPPAPQMLPGYMSGGWHVQGWAQPGATLHVYDDSVFGDATAPFAVTTTDGSFDVNLLWWSLPGGVVIGGDMLVLWSEAPGGAISTRVLQPENDLDDRAPLAPTSVVALRAGGLVLVSGQCEIGTSVTVINQTQSVPPGMGASVWSASGTALKATFSVAVTAQTGDQLAVVVKDASGSSSQPYMMTAP